MYFIERIAVSTRRSHTCWSISEWSVERSKLLERRLWPIDERKKRKKVFFVKYLMKKILITDWKATTLCIGTIFSKTISKFIERRSIFSGFSIRTVNGRRSDLDERRIKFGWVFSSGKRSNLEGWPEMATDSCAHDTRKARWTISRQKAMPKLQLRTEKVQTISGIQSFIEKVPISARVFEQTHWTHYK